MNTRPVRVAVIGAVTCLILGGCGDDGALPDAVSPTVSPNASPDATASPSSGAGSNEPGRRKDRAKDQTTDESTDGADGSGQSPQPSPSASPGTSGDDSDEDGTDTTAPGSAPALEMPKAPGAPVVSRLSELLAPTNPAPLVTTPLPRGANALGRLLRQFPEALRPPRGARVESSSLSPMGDRLQVGLVATTALSPAQVMIAYRTRLARRGMDETAPPPSVAGSHAASFRRGDSVVTVTVSPRGSGSSYAVHASLRAAGG